jgi:hypothetical protein
MRVKGIARYTHLVNASAPRGTDKLKFSINVLVHKNDPQVPQIQAELNAAIANGFPSGMPANGHTCWHDMAVKEPGNATLADYMCLAASTNASMGRPTFVNSKLEPVIDPSVDGDTNGKIVYIDAGFGTYNQGSVGVKAYLNGVMSTDKEGEIPFESLSSKPTANSMFGDVAETAPTRF